jgi:hypothetical protein
MEVGLPMRYSGSVLSTGTFVISSHGSSRYRSPSSLTPTRKPVELTRLGVVFPRLYGQPALLNAATRVGSAT